MQGFPNEHFIYSQELKGLISVPAEGIEIKLYNDKLVHYRIEYQ